MIKIRELIFKFYFLFDQEKARQTIQALDCKIDGIFFVSAKTGDGVTETFKYLTELLVKEKLNERNPLRAGGKLKKGDGDDVSELGHDADHRMCLAQAETLQTKSACCVIL